MAKSQVSKENKRFGFWISGLGLRDSRQGFSIVELLVVIAIIGFIGSIILDRKSVV